MNRHTYSVIKKNSSTAVWKRLLIMLLAVATASGLGLRILELQLVHGQQFRVQADNNRFYQLQLPANRGLIYDRYQQPLALNTKRYFRLDEPNALYSHRQELTRTDGLRWLATDSAQVVTENVRHYPYASATAHVVGYVGQVSAEELAEDPSRSLIKQYGKYGLEKNFDQQLQGVDGSQRFEINALGQRQRLISEQMPKAGESIVTTLDPYVSTAALQAMGQQKGAVIVADALTGDILTLISTPSFDPNQLSQQWLDPTQEQSRVEYVKALFRAEDQPMFDRAVSGVYPPGSIFKLVTALAGLETGAVTPQTEVEDTGVLKVGEYSYGNWYYRQYGRVDGLVSLVRAIAHSNDIYFYKAAEWIGPTQLADFASLFGFGQPIDIGLYPMAKGIVPNPAWKQSVFGERWYLGNTYHFGIGQGDLLVSPLQVLQMLLAIGHEGILCQPRLLEGGDQDCVGLGLQPANVETVLRGMIDACAPNGTAFPFFSRNQAVADQLEGGGSVVEWLDQGAVACKTGTAEFGGADHRGYRDTHGWFVALVEPTLNLNPEAELAADQPATDSAELASLPSQVADQSLDQLYQDWQTQASEHGFPDRIAIVVLVESDDQEQFREGSGDAAPIAKFILDWLEGQSPEPEPELE